MTPKEKAKAKEKAKEIFEKHWIKATGKALDENTKHYMNYAIEAVYEALLLDEWQEVKQEIEKL